LALGDLVGKGRKGGGYPSGHSPVETRAAFPHCAKGTCPQGHKATNTHPHNIELSTENFPPEKIFFACFFILIGFKGFRRPESRRK